MVGIVSAKLSAAAAVAHRLGWVDRNIAVHMPGGVLKINTKWIGRRGPNAEEEEQWIADTLYAEKHGNQPKRPQS